MFIGFSSHSFSHFHGHITRLTVVSSGNKFVNIAGHICDYYNGADIEIYSSDEVCLDDDYYEAKSEYYEDH